MTKKIVLNKDQVNEKFLHLYKKSYIPPKYSVYFGGSGSGKSFSVLDSLVYRCIKYGTFDIVILRKTASTLTNTVRLPLEGIINKRYKLTKGVDYTFTKQELRYEFNSGSRIRLLGYDDPEKVKGIDGVNVVVLEEMTDFTKDDLADIVDRARTKPPKNHIWKDIKVIGMFNPIYETHWVRSHWLMETKDASDDVYKYYKNDVFGEDLFVLKTTWRDNKWYDGKYLDPEERKREKLLNPRKYSVYCNGNFGILGKLVFEDNIVFVDATKEEMLSKGRKEPAYGIDFGFGDPSTFNGYQMDEQGDLWVFEETGGPQLRTSEFSNLIKTLHPNDYKYLVIQADSSARTTIEDMRNDYGFQGIKSVSKDPILSGLEWLKDRKIYVNRKLTPGIAGEFESYEYEKDKKTGLYKPLPKDLNNHYIDNARYATRAYRKQGWSFA
ncbi:MAG: hypothetical protein GY804_01205 [Alphaproteobacteria bacterium]|nr:hypothetical protein [Alphaproteobacteria bacterium]